MTFEAIVLTLLVAILTIVALVVKTQDCSSMPDPDDKPGDAWVGLFGYLVICLACFAGHYILPYIIVFLDFVSW